MRAALLIFALLGLCLPGQPAPATDGIVICSPDGARIISAAEAGFPTGDPETGLHCAKCLVAAIAVAGPASIPRPIRFLTAPTPPEATTPPLPPGPFRRAPRGPPLSA